MKKEDSTENIKAGFKDRMDVHNSASGKFADFLTEYFGTVTFLLLNGLFFLVWILINTGFIPFLKSFDPYPFGLLTTIVSLEAIFLSIIVLVSQNRASKIADAREELDFEINVRAEEEITRVVKMLDEIHDHLGLDPIDDTELTQMKERIDIRKLGDQIQRRRN